MAIRGSDNENPIAGKLINPKPPAPMNIKITNIIRAAPKNLGCFANMCSPPIFEPVISKIIERMHDGAQIIIREVVANTTQNVGDPHFVSVPGLTLLDGGLKEGRHRSFFKRVKTEEKGKC